MNGFQNLFEILILRNLFIGLNCYVKILRLVPTHQRWNSTETINLIVVDKLNSLEILSPSPFKWATIQELKDELLSRIFMWDSLKNLLFLCWVSFKWINLNIPTPTATTKSVTRIVKKKNNLANQISLQDFLKRIN